MSHTCTLLYSQKFQQKVNALGKMRACAPCLIINLDIFLSGLMFNACNKPDKPIWQGFNVKDFTVVNKGKFLSS